jgi:hypothetical protein
MLIMKMGSSDPKQAIDAQIKRLQSIRELLDDPEAVAILAKLFAGKSNGNSASALLEPAAAATQMEMPAAEPTGPKRGEQLKTVETVLRSALTQVNTEWMVNRMLEQGFTFKSSSPRVAVNECLRTLQERGRARIAKTEGVTNYWEYIKESEAK